MRVRDKKGRNMYESRGFKTAERLTHYLKDKFHAVSCSVLRGAQARGEPRSADIAKNTNSAIPVLTQKRWSVIAWNQAPSAFFTARIFFSGFS